MKTTTRILWSVILLLGTSLPTMCDGDPPSVILKCSEDSTTDLDAQQVCTTVSGQDEAAKIKGREFIELHFLGLGKPGCDASDCGSGQDCEPGSQINSGTITYSYEEVGSFTRVCATVSAGTETQQHCTDCS